MRIVFMGTPEFAVPSLEILVQSGYDVVAVVTSTDSWGGRGGKVLLESAVKKCAQRLGIPVLQPTNLKSERFVEELRNIKADVQIVVAFRMLPEIVWNMPPLGTFNLHGSMLPKYRGAAPINHAIIQGESMTGVTSFRLQHAIDTGDVLIQRQIPILDTDTAGDLHDRMMLVGADVILETVQILAEGKARFLPQNDVEATAAPKLFHETCKIDFSQTTKKVYDFIRGLSPHPAAWFLLDGKEVKILRCSKVMKPDASAPGTIRSDLKKYVHIKSADGYISIDELKQEGKKSMPVAVFLNGVHHLPNQIDS